VSRTLSPSTKKPYGVRLVVSELGVPRSTFYAARKRAALPTAPARRGPRTKYTDAVLLEHIREDLSQTQFVGEGHRKVWARLRHKDIRTSKARTLRLMRDANLLAPTRQGRVLGPRSHDGTITTAMPDEMWGTDATSVFTRVEGYATVFVAVDHCTSEAIGIHASKIGDRFEALEPIRQGVRAHFGGYDAAVAYGLKLRHDHGSQYMSDAFQSELSFLGIESSPAFVRSPEGNGCSERFIRTLKEQLLWVRVFDTVEELRLALLAWIKTYNEHWLVERHGHRAPATVRKALVATQQAA